MASADELPEIPEDAPVLVMHSARSRYPDSPLVRRGRNLRAFSRDTAREILTFVVEKNLAALHATLRERVAGAPAARGSSPGATAAGRSPH